MLKIMVLCIIVCIRITVCNQITMIGIKCDVLIVLGGVSLLRGTGIVCLSLRSFVQVVTVSSTAIIIGTLASTNVPAFAGFMSEHSAVPALQFAFESAFGSIVISAFADPAIHLQGCGVVLIVSIAGNPAGEWRFGIVSPMSKHGLVDGLSRSRLAGLPLLILLLEYANDLLSVNVFLGIHVNEIQLTSNELISVLIPRLRQGRCDDMFEEELGHLIVCVPEEAELIPALLKLRDMLRDVVILRSGGIHKHVEVRCQDKMGFGLMHRLQTEPHAIGGRATIGMNPFHWRYIACDEQLGERVVIHPVLGTLCIVLQVQANNFA